MSYFRKILIWVAYYPTCVLSVPSICASFFPVWSNQTNTPQVFQAFCASCPILSNFFQCAIEAHVSLSPSAKCQSHTRRLVVPESTRSRVVPSKAKPISSVSSNSSLQAEASRRWVPIFKPSPFPPVQKQPPPSPSPFPPLPTKSSSSPFPS